MPKKTGCSNFFKFELRKSLIAEAIVHRISLLPYSSDNFSFSFGSSKHFVIFLKIGEKKTVFVGKVGPVTAINSLPLIDIIAKSLPFLLIVSRG